MSHLVPFGVHVFLPVLMRWGDDGDLLDHMQIPSMLERFELLGIVGQDANLAQAEILEDLQSDHVIALIGFEAELVVRLDRVQTNNPKKLESFEHTWDLHVVEQVPIIAPPHEHRQKYMDTKRDKMGHKLPPAN